MKFNPLPQLLMTHYAVKDKTRSFLASFINLNNSFFDHDIHLTIPPSGQMAWRQLFFLFTLLLLALAGRDFYKILGVNKSASKKEIKKAYRKLAMKYHPDKNPGDDTASDKFKEIGEVYEILADDDKRKTYDRHGEDGIKNMQQGGGHDPFANFFGHFGFGQQQEEQQEHKGSDVVVDLFVSLEELYLGNFVTVKRDRPTYEETSGTRQCNCRMEMKTHMTGPGSFQVISFAY